MEILYPTATFQFELLNIEEKILDRDQALLTLLRGWLLHLGPTHNKELQNILYINENDITQTLIRLENTGLILRGHFCFSDKNILEWCERRILARIHHLTIGHLRKEIAPISAAEFMHWLLRWQHLAIDSQLEGEQGLLEVITQLQGFEMPANVWEKQIFAKRVKNYTKDMLDRLCLMGLVGWGRISTSSALEQTEKKSTKRIIPSSTVPITFFLRENFSWNETHEKNHDKLTHTAKEIYDYLKQHGASFFNDIERNVKRLKAEIENGLWELVAVGLVTADGFDSLRALIDPRRRLKRKYRSNSLRFNSGRWSILNKVHQEEEMEKKLENICWTLLKRYGVVFRDLLKKEKNLPRWRELLIVFRRLEDRGEIRGGRFVQGFLGEQFALPYAVSSLRLMRKMKVNDELLSIAAPDPLNLIGIILPGPRIASSSKQKIMLKNGIPI